MASGIDDEVTLRANREGFLKFQLRPRRLVDVSKVDMSVEILGVKYPSPIVLAPVGGQRSFHDEGEVASARAAKVGIICRFSRPRPASGSRTSAPRAASRSGTSSMPPTNGKWRRPW
jgi:L-lactate dehydrogenase (FMN-dependent) and related alpha-hydroxy acid dehydrogenases